jgi:hypothetical protein
MKRINGLVVALMMVAVVIACSHLVNAQTQIPPKADSDILTANIAPYPKCIQPLVEGVNNSEALAVCSWPALVMVPNCVGLLESDGTDSDVVLSIDGAELFMVSDGFPGFQTWIAICLMINPNPPVLTENGQFQDLSGYFALGQGSILAFSDVNNDDKDSGVKKPGTKLLLKGGRPALPSAWPGSKPQQGNNVSTASELDKRGASDKQAAKTDRAAPPTDKPVPSAGAGGGSGSPQLWQ